MRRVALAAAALANIAQVVGKVEPVPLLLSKGLCPPPDLPHRSSIIADLCCERAGCTAFPTTCPPRCQGAYITYYEECGAQLPLDSNPSFESFASACDALGPMPPPPPGGYFPPPKWEEPPVSQVRHDVEPCATESAACQADSFCKKFMDEQLKGATMQHCETNALCDAMIACAMDLAKDMGRQSDKPGKPPASPVSQDFVTKERCCAQNEPCCPSYGTAPLAEVDDDVPDWEDGGCTYNVRVRAYEGEGCTGCEPCTAACNAEAVLGGKARPGEPGYDPHSRVQDNQDDLGPRSLLPCQLGTVRFYGPP